MDKERQMAKQMMDKLIADMANTENRAKETALSKTAYENKIQALQNELNVSIFYKGISNKGQSFSERKTITCKLLKMHKPKFRN